MQVLLLPVLKQTKKKSGGGGCIGTKLGAEQQNTVSVVYECRLGTNTGFSVKLSDCSQPTAWALNTAFVLSHHQRHWEAKSSNTWPLAAFSPHYMQCSEQHHRAASSYWSTSVKTPSVCVANILYLYFYLRFQLYKEHHWVCINCGNGLTANRASYKESRHSLPLHYR